MGVQGPCESGWVVADFSCGQTGGVCCVASTCIEAGQYGSSTQACCDGSATPIQQDLGAVIPVGGSQPVAGATCELSSDMVVCTHCGDGICEFGETSCNCENDCPACTQDSDCSQGGSCVGNVCQYCGIQQCYSGMDDDCDGISNDELCESTPCAPVTGYQPTPFQFIVADPQPYKGKLVMIVAWTKVGAATCLANPVGCAADLMLEDHGWPGQGIPLVQGGGGPPVLGCTGLTASSLNCAPFSQGKTVVVWGKIVLKNTIWAFEYQGHCGQ